jgi:predicted nucleic acid-binding protein
LSYLLDTNVLSELQRKAPNKLVQRWFNERPATSLYLSVLTLGELRKGIEGIAELRRRLAMSDWLEVKLPAFFNGRILSVDHQVSDRWGRLAAKAGRPIAAIDSLIGATASHHGLSLVTRNTKDFESLNLEIINPWNED